jgi:rhodanese-related sulfurtransferase
MQPTPISAADAKQMLDLGEQVTFVDARNPVAWGEATHKLPDAIRVPVDAVDDHLSELPPDRTLVTYCT